MMETDSVLICSYFNSPPRAALLTDESVKGFIASLLLFCVEFVFLFFVFVKRGLEFVAQSLKRDV